MAKGVKRTKAAPARAREDADVQVRQCLDMMASGRWVIGQSHLAIAEEHGVHPDTAGRWATAASRVLRIALEGDVEQIRAQMVATLGTIIAGTMAGEPRTSIAAMELQSKLLGLVVQKHEVAMTDDECRDLVQRAAKLAK